MTRMRSPNYPAIPLKQAVDFIDKIFRSDRTNIIDKEVAAEHMGYTGLNGRTLKLLGALSAFGLLDKVGKGKVRVSKVAVSILHGIDDAEKQSALLAAATTPALFKRIRDTFDQPSDKTITSFLMKEGFTDAAVGPVLKSYNETNAFLAASGVSESYGNSDADEPDSMLDERDDEDEAMDTVDLEKPEAKSEKSGGVKLFHGGPLDFNLSSSGLRITGSTNSSAQLKAFIEKLNALAVLLPEDSTDDE